MLTLAIIGQFINDVMWGDLDFLVVDTPPGTLIVLICPYSCPGTSDEHISVTEKLQFANPKAVIVTTPQEVSISDVEKEISFCRRVNLPILGLIENMSGFMCPCCDVHSPCLSICSLTQEVTNIFGGGGGKNLAEKEKIPFLGSIPIDPTIPNSSDSNASFIEKHKNARNLQALVDFVDRLVSTQ